MGFYKELEFQKFLELIPSGDYSTWQSIAEALGVDEDTITRWKKTPEANKAILEGIDNGLKEMKLAGKKDWRMWAEYLKMLGINPTQKHQLEINDPRRSILEQYGLEDASKTKKT